MNLEIDKRDKDNLKLAMLTAESQAEARLLIEVLENWQGRETAPFLNQLPELQKASLEPAGEDFPALPLTERQLRWIGKNLVSGEARIKNLKDPKRATLAYK